ncbi:MAG TPA: hypothetical protein VFY48_08110 [Solirubrobacterales bacterium]|nr:hypothetical protein [Solirubrobacterales bacterium]
MLKKMTVLAMAVGVVAALALPASASATWKHGQTAIEKDEQLGLTGNARFQGGLGGVECQVTSKITFQAGQTTGKVESFVPHPTSDTLNCKGLAGLAFCQIHDVTPFSGASLLSTQNPWVLHTWAESTGGEPPVIHQKDLIHVTSGNITSTLTGGFCPVKHIMLTGGTVVATPNQPNNVTSVQLSGTLLAHLQTNNHAEGQSHTENVTVSGTLTIEEPKAHTYSI